MSTRDWDTLIRQKRALRESQIPKEWRLPERITSRANRDSSVSAFSLLDETAILTEQERAITGDYDATALLEMLATGTLSSLSVTVAFCKRAAIAHQLINPLTEIFFDKALDRARDCDAYLARYGKPMGPFHGLPISLKDMFMVKGEYATLGFVSYLDKPAAEHNSVIVDMLLAGGAVLYCKTTVPQGLFTIDSESQLFGCTLNPQRLCLTAGGSSSGEGALVGFRGSPLGVGTDIGGSIRCPSLLNGCFGFKPTANRLPFSGQQFHFPDGWPGVVPAAGPHAHSARDMTSFCKTIIQGEAWRRDATVLYAPWRDIPIKTKLRIGVWMGVDEMPLSRPVTRAPHAAADLLRGAGHEVLAVATPNDAGFLPVLETYIKSLNLDSDHTLMKFVETGNEELLPALAETKAALDSLDTATLADVWNINATRDRPSSAWHGVLSSVDVLMCPGSRGVGAQHGSFGVPFYTLIWNLLDCPASVVPFLKADKTIDNDDDADLMDGIACSVQIVGWRGQDEEVLMATEVISGVLSPVTAKASL